MTGFEPQASGVGSDRSANWATNTARTLLLFVIELWSEEDENKQKCLHIEIIVYTKREHDKKSPDKLNKLGWC